ncbi:hypothetical protein predicted by Glimmer/Critica [Sorangium cellulosum So ce56]|uniref:Uncharacterized protein n=2 Tax=Sorangium cellulosum TaxID=56 RepID=A9FJQ4_SORC5|nr:hypothetical protein predicted by Glimmer/Critica [Sorangium cellulosum So ce56]
MGAPCSSRIRLRVSVRLRARKVVRPPGGGGNSGRASPAPEEAADALSAVLARMQPGEVAIVVQRLAELSPRRRHLVAFLPALSQRLGSYAAKHHVAVGEGLLAALKADALAVPQYLGLASRLLPWKALAQAASPKNGWNADRRELLERYRKDPSPAVAGPASFVMPP